MPENFNLDSQTQKAGGSGWTEGIKKNLIPIAVVVAGLLVAAVIYVQGPGKEKISPLLPQKAAEKALNYINQNLLEGATATIGQVTEENGIYKLQLKVDSQTFDSYVTRDGQLLFIQGIDLSKDAQSGNGTAEQTGTTIGSFSVSSDEICRENGKPIIYFFGSNSCPHCLWEHPIFQQVAANFADYISFHDNLDSEDDSEIFARYSNGGVPTLVLGCRYYRIGSGENSGEDKETQNLTALFCKLTSGQPESICSSVKDLMDQIQ